MKPYFFSIIISFLALSAIYGQERGTVTILSNPPNCWIRIDSVLVGRTPLYQFSLSTGKHVVQIYPNQSGIWNVEEKIFHITLSANQDTTLTATFSRPVFINSVPFGATLLQDSSRIGVTPLYIPFEENKGKRFELRKSGYIPYFFTLDTVRSIFVTLRQQQDFVEEPQKPQLLGFIPKRRLKSKFTLLAVTVAAHWASFYFKNEADDNFEKYNRTADPRLMDKYWSRTKKYDRLSAISLGVSYASLAGLIYMVIWK